MNRWLTRHAPMLIWAPGALLLIYIAGIDLYLPEQFLLSLICVMALLALRFRFNRDTNNHSPLRMSRLILLVVGGFLATRYMMWRVEYSIPWEEDTFSLVCSLALLAAEILAYAIYFMGAFVNLHPLRREPVPFDMRRKDLPVVDVYVPTFNESPELLRTTLLAATNMHYPHDKLRVYLLDDGGTEAKCAAEGEAGKAARERKAVLQELCTATKCHYLTRAANNYAKAGNINAALAHTDGDYVLVLDSDHVPTIDFLENTVGTMMENYDVAVVQTPHFMINRDPIEKNLKTDRLMPSEGEMFYTLNLRGMDNWGATFFCGSGALIRRKALDEIGGLCTQTIVEDAETSIELTSRGYKWAYIHRPMLSGLSTESSMTFLSQRSRWGSGMIQLLRLKSPLTIPGLNLAQRVCYLNCIFFWLFSLARVVFVLAPIVSIIFGATLFATPPTEIFLYLLPHLIALLIVSNVLYGRVRWLFVSEVYEMLQSFFLAGTFIQSLLKPRNKHFIVTPKTESLDENMLSGISGRFYLIVALQLLAMGVGAYYVYILPDGMVYYLFSMLWNGYNLIFALAALGVLIERKQVRHRPRVAMHEVAQVQLDHRSFPCEIVDMSEDGASIRLPSWMDSMKQKEGFLLFSKLTSKSGSLTTMMKHMSAVHFEVCSLRKVGDGDNHHYEAGVRFQYQNIHERRAVVGYVYGDSDHWRRMLKARNQPSTMRQGGWFAIRAACYGIQHIVLRLRAISTGSRVLEKQEKRHV